MIIMNSQIPEHDRISTIKFFKSDVSSIYLTPFMQVKTLSTPTWIFSQKPAPIVAYMSK